MCFTLNIFLTYNKERLGLREPPPLEAKTVGKMGLKGVPGLNIYGRGGIAPKEDRGGGRW